MFFAISQLSSSLLTVNLAIEAPNGILSAAC